MLVAGYSGRDQDVLPLFLNYRPAVIHWLQHNPDEEKSPELAGFLDAAGREGIDVQLHYGPATPLLQSIIVQRSCRNSEGFIHTPNGKPRTPPTPRPDLARRLEEVDTSTRKAALAIVIADLGMWDEPR